jgi:hypothetical protein
LQGWNESQVFYLQNLSISFAEYYTCCSFRDKVSSVNDPTIKALLNDYLILYTLTVINSDIAILRDNDYIKSSTVYLVRDTILDLISRLKQTFLPVLDMIGPEDHILTSPLGVKDTDNMYIDYTNKLFKK